MTSDSQEKAISRVLHAIDAIRAGQMVIMVDDEDRENEGDLVFAAEHVSADKINFMVREARGLVCLAVAPAVIDRLKLPMMTDTGKQVSSKSTAFTVSIEARHGVSTGISAADRAETIRVAIDEKSTPDDIVVPGHVFPLKAKSGGVLERSGHTEGSVDLVRLAGLKPAAVICEIMKDDGTMARMPDLEVFSRRHNMPVVSIADLIEFRLLRDSLVEEVARSQVETPAGIFEARCFRNVVDGAQHFALVKGDAFHADQVVEVRVHRQRPLIDVFSSRQTGRKLVDYGLNLLKSSGHCVVLYLSHPGGSQAFADDTEDMRPHADSGAANGAAGQTQGGNKWRAMDPRLYGIGAQILRQLGVRRMRIHVSTPRSLKGLAGFGLEIVDSVVIGH